MMIFTTTADILRTNHATPTGSKDDRPLHLKVLKGLSLDSKENVPFFTEHGDGSKGSKGGAVGAKCKEPLRPSSSNGVWVAIQLS